MAEAVVFGILCKIGSILGSQLTQALAAHLGIEVSVFVEIESSVKQIRSEFRLMQAFLQDGQDVGSHGRQAETFLQEVQRISFEVEDILDEFVYLFSRKQAKSVRSFRNCFRKSGSVMSFHRLAVELKELQNRLQNLRNLKLQYNIDFSKESASSISYEDIQGRTLHGMMHSNKFVGFANERRVLQEMLMENKTSRSIISIWGMGGSGKTTLINTVSGSKAIKNRFGCLIWVTVSQTYEINEVMKRIIKCALKDACPANLENMNSAGVAAMLQRTLQGRTYMMILDDVWDTNVWYSLEALLDVNSIGSKVVITTRTNDVASLADDNHRLRLRGLDDAESWDLFCLWAFRHANDQTCPPRTERVARKILDKCEHLPLAITSVGNLLSFKRLDPLEWDKFHSELNWELDNCSNNQELSKVARLLSLSYKHLPSHLKNCFLLCSIFPEDYLIHGWRLCRLIISEGLVVQRNNRTQEEIAMEYVENLVDRCLLQVAIRYKLDMTLQLQMHDIVRELAISISAKDGFCRCIQSNAKTLVFDYEPRRLSIHGSSERAQLSINASRIRSFYQFDSDSMSNGQWMSRTARYLKILELASVPITTLPRDIGSLFNLHYLGLRRTKIKQLPESIGRLQNLQTLDIYLTEIGNLPRGITRLRMLRHLTAGKAVASYFGLEDAFTGAKIPSGSWQPLDLNVLTGISASSNLVEQLSNLTRLRALKLTDVKSIHHAKLFASIRKMQLLRTLRIETANSDEYVNLEDLYPAPWHLEILFLKGRLHDSVVDSKLFEASRLSLQQLTLKNSRMSIDPLPSLSCFCNLGFLGLFNHYTGENLVFQAGWFPKLHKLTLAELKNLNSIVIEQYSMPNLYNLSLICLTNLEYLPQGMEFLKSVEELSLVGMHQKFMEDVQDTSNEKVKHIAVIDYFDQSKGRWDRLSQVYGKDQDTKLQH
uniref:NB-ARC domain-containing protein n=1 Tax=Leersia perrieri TaxID=77586 RepID=A0A0D9WFW4_9ORYZ